MNSTQSKQYPEPVAHVRGYPVGVFSCSGMVDPEVFHHANLYVAKLDENTTCFGRTLEELEEEILQAENNALEGLYMPSPTPDMPEPPKTPYRAVQTPSRGIPDRANSALFEWLFREDGPSLDAPLGRIRIFADGKEVIPREWYVADGEIRVEGGTE